ncbi:MAG: MBL fold metallo-hydrolase [Rikenellaceae bacterium]
MIKIKVFAVNPFREVTYVVSDESSKECVIIDAAASEVKERERIENYISKNELSVKLLINTHCHIDHILAINYFKNKYGVEFAASESETLIVESAEASARMYGLPTDDDFVPTIDKFLNDEDIITFGESSLKVIATPGHTIGGVSFYHEETKTLFTGDTLFKGTIGRTDLPTGDYDVLMGSILYKILPLGGETTIYPGHGDHSSLAQEAMHNPFVNEVLTDKVNPVSEL